MSLSLSCYVVAGLSGIGVCNQSNRMEAILTILFFIVAGFYLLGLVGRLVLRYWLQKKQREFAQNFGEGQGGFTFKQYTWGRPSGARSRRAKRTGEVRVEEMRHIEKRVNRNVGEYVEYEEIDVRED